MTIAELRTAVRKKQFSPVYLLAGSEDFLIDESVRLIVDHALDPAMRTFNLDVMYGSKASARELVARASAFPMMSERRVVIVKESEKLGRTDADRELLASYVARPLESTLLIFISMEGDLRKKPFTDIRKYGEVVDCKSLQDRDVPMWIEGHAMQMGKTITPDAVSVLHTYVGNSLRVLHSELEKLSTYVGDRNEITADDVTAVVGATKGYTVFDLQDAVGAKDSRRALYILGKMMQRNESPQFIIVLLTRFFLNLWKIQELRMKRSPELEIATLTGIHHRYIGKHIGFQSNFTPGQIERAFRALLEADTTLKSTTKDPKIVMEMLVYELINGSRQQENAAV